MKTNLKRTLSIILTLALIMGMVPISSVSAAEDDRIEIYTDSLQEVSKANADDVLGDGTVSYDFDTNTLTLNGADVNVILAYCDLNILLTESDNKVHDSDELSTAAIYVTGDLSISGNGTLSAEACGKYGSSEGIYAKGSIIIDGANVTAKGADVLLTHSDSYETGYARSMGVLASDNIDIKGNGSLTAIGGKTRGYTADSKGVYSGSINIYDGSLYAESAVAEGKSGAFSQGIFIGLGDLNLFDADSKVDVKGGFARKASDSKEPRTAIMNSAVFLIGGDVNAHAGTLNVYSEGSEETSEYTFGIEAAVSSEYNEEDGSVTDSGGNINISSDCPNDIKINVSCLHGSALMAGNDINIDKLMEIADFDGGKIKKCEFQGVNGPYYMWTVVDSNGELVKKVEIKAATDVNFLLGDVDDDGKITASDALMVLKHAAKLITLRGYANIVGECTLDNIIDADDALDILKYAARIEK